jgi:dipeptidyl aminopeptidase/acylaminoacyl peptidase
MRIRVLLLVISRCILINSIAQKPLTPDVYDSWKNINESVISNDGRFVSWEVNPEQGDGWLYLYDETKSTLDSVARGYNAKFSSGSKYLVFQIKPCYSVTRKAKLDKKKKEDLPKDSLGIWLLNKDTVLKLPPIRSYVLPAESTNDWLAIWYSFSEDKIDTTLHKSAQGKSNVHKKSKQIKETGRLQFLDPITGNDKFYRNVLEVNSSRNGTSFAFSYFENDTSEKTSLEVFEPVHSFSRVIIRGVNAFKNITLDDSGKQLAFLIGSDTSKTTSYSLFYWEISQFSAFALIDTLTQGMKHGWAPSENSKIWFSNDGTRLFFGTAAKSRKDPKDTLLEEEKVSLDVWNWQDEQLQPQQKVQLEAEKKYTYLALCYPKNKKFIQLADSILHDVITPWKGTGDYAIAYEKKPYLKMSSWDASDYKNLYSINLNSGERKLLALKSAAQYYLSPNGKYILWYSPADSSWHCTNLSSGIATNLTKKLNVNFYYELNDIPALPGSYGFSGWFKNDNIVLINDRYDIWKIDLTGRELPVNITAAYGRMNSIQFRTVNLEPDNPFINNSNPIVLTAFNEVNKEGGYYKLDSRMSSHPTPLWFGKNSYSGITKSKNTDVIIWRRGTFTEFNDLWLVKSMTENPVRLSNANPQQSNYLWGSVRLVEWNSLNKEKLQGLLYTPDNMQPGKKYPMLIYFYERNSDGLYVHNIPAPSRSIVNREYCTSNGYILFVPDIIYKVGYPGPSAMDAVISGCLAVCDQFDFIDKNNIGLEGHSWGGYQVAYLITQTNLFKAAMAGAPVSNMTSAYGGIRWSTGISRMFQYEQGQSRIGGNLWDKTMLFIDNSPIFNVPKIITPLLILHNDMDGAVPWYQGIELFNAMRRLNKPVWMLTYNGEDHNLTRRPNMKDLSIRMMQFFDYYLKGAAEPKWMAEGIPAINKGKSDGLELEK